jgi:hypothetical protein
MHTVTVIRQHGQWMTPTPEDALDLFGGAAYLPLPFTAQATEAHIRTYYADRGQQAIFAEEDNP